MPARSKKQQQAAGVALAAKRDKRATTVLRGASKQMYESMSERELRDIAHTPQTPLPKRARREER